uniref:Uncharacterized protein n=1 Tax=Rhizophagus irregularis (strain DAOM 181602 / DAOM 197198 / MUCL 43194) TaxID=747089 RepID=U9UPL7_RHIID
MEYADNGNLREIEGSSNFQSSTKLFGVMSYVDSKSFSNQGYELNKKSDIFNIYGRDI